MLPCQWEAFFVDIFCAQFWTLLTTTVMKQKSCIIFSLQKVWSSYLKFRHSANLNVEHSTWRSWHLRLEWSGISLLIHSVLPTSCKIWFASIALYSPTTLWCLHSFIGPWKATLAVEYLRKYSGRLYDFHNVHQVVLEVVNRRSTLLTPMRETRGQLKYWRYLEVLTSLYVMVWSRISLF